MAYVKFMSNATLRDRAGAALDSIASKEAREFGADPLPYVIKAGDAIEAMLADFLIRLAKTEEEGVRRLKQDLKTLIDDCETAGGISLCTKHLCHGVREMRNLVHPTRAARTGQVISSSHFEAAARVAALVRSEVQANTPVPPRSDAEELWLDLEWNDVLELTLGELVDALPRPERSRLLLEVIPAQMAEIDISDNYDANIIPDRAWRCATAALPRVSKAVRHSYWEWLSQKLRELDHSEDQDLYLHACFIATHLNDARKVTRDFLVAYVVSFLKTQRTVLWPAYLVGIAPCLKLAQVDPLVRVLARSVVKAPDDRRKTKCAEILTAEAAGLAKPLRDEAVRVLDELVTWCETHAKTEWASEIASIRYAVSPLGDNEIPR